MWNMFRQHGLEQNKGIIATERKVAVLNKQVTEHQTWDSLTWLKESQSISVVAFAKVIDSHHFKLPHSPHCQGVDGQEDQRQRFLNGVPGPPSQHHPRTLTKPHMLRPYRGVLDSAIQIIYTPKTQGYWIERWLLQGPAVSTPGPPNLQCAMLYLLIDFQSSITVLFFSAWLVFPRCYGRVPEKSNLKEVRFYCGSWLERYSLSWQGGTAAEWLQSWDDREGDW